MRRDDHVQDHFHFPHFSFSCQIFLGRFNAIPRGPLCLLLSWRGGFALCLLLNPRSGPRNPGEFLNVCTQARLWLTAS